MTALMWASFNNNAVSIQALLRAGSKPNIRAKVFKMTNFTMFFK